MAVFVFGLLVWPALHLVHSDCDGATPAPEHDRGACAVCRLAHTAIDPPVTAGGPLPAAAPSVSAVQPPRAISAVARVAGRAAPRAPPARA